VKSRKQSVIVAWLLCLFCIVVASVGLVTWLLDQSSWPTLFDFVEAFGWGWALPVLFSVLAALIISRQPRNRVGWLLMLPALVTAVSPQGFLATPPETLTPGRWLLLWFDTGSWILVIFPVFLIPLHFPTGRPPSARWNWINWLAIGMWAVFMVLVAFDDTIGPLNYTWRLPNPIGFIPFEEVEGPFLIIWGIGLVTVVLASVVSLFVRYRRARADERQQIKWLLYAGAVFAVVYSTLLIVNSGVGDDSIRGWTNLLLVLSILAFPVAIAIAILRYQLFDIDVIIRKTLVYAALTGLLALVYLGSVVLLQSIVEAVSGQESAISIVVSTLIIAALFAPLRRRIQGFIDRRFYRRKYDAVQTLTQFSRTARQEVELEALTAELLRVIQDTMQPDLVSLWLKPEKGNDFRTNTG
jgi:hypothetical protein